VSASTGSVEFYPPNTADLVWFQGARFRLVVGVSCDWEPDFTGWVAKMEVRPNRSATAVLLADMSAYVSVNAVAGQATVDIPANAAQLQFESAEETWTHGVYDIEITPGTAPDPTRTLRVLQGNVTLDLEVTR
jgi:hypothetical protein